MMVKLSQNDLKILQDKGSITVGGNVIVELEKEWSFCDAYDKFCRYNDAKYPEIYDLRKTPHWFDVIHSSNENMRIGDKILVTRGYVTNVTQGWTYDPLESERRTCGPSYGGTDWVPWHNNRCVCFNNVVVIKR